MSERELTIRHRVDFFWIFLALIFCAVIAHDAIQSITIRSVYVDRCLSVDDCRARVIEADAKGGE